MSTYYYIMKTKQNEQPTISMFDRIPCSANVDDFLATW